MVSPCSFRLLIQLVCVALFLFFLSISFGRFFHYVPFLFLINCIHSSHSVSSNIRFFFPSSKSENVSLNVKWKERNVCAKPLKTKSNTHENIKSPPAKKKMIYSVDIMWLCLFATTDIYRCTNAEHKHTASARILSTLLSASTKHKCCHLKRWQCLHDQHHRRNHHKLYLSILMWIYTDHFR